MPPPPPPPPPPQDAREPATATLGPPLPTPTYGTTGLFSVRAAVTIRAPAARVHAATTAIHRYAEWNTFVPTAAALDADAPLTHPLRVGTHMLFHAHVRGPAAAPHTATVVVTVLEPVAGSRAGWRVAWKALGFPGLRSERVQEMVEVEGEEAGPAPRTEYVTWETFGGPLAYVLRWWMGADLRDRFGDWARDLKGFCEGEGGVVGEGL